MELCGVLGTDLHNLRNELEKYIPLDPTTLLQRKFWDFVMQLAKDDENVKKELAKTYTLFHKMYLEKKPFPDAFVEVLKDLVELKKVDVDEMKNIIFSRNR
jgi:hypothetical protein